MIQIENHGPLLISTNFWGSAEEQAGRYIVSPNAGAIRLLLPRSLEAALKEMGTGREVLISRGPWPEMRLDSATEILFDDATDDPFALHCSLESWLTLPAADDVGKEWIFTVWTVPRRGRPHKALERPCWYRLVPKIPWLKPRVKVQ